MKNGVFLHWGIYSIPAFCPVQKRKTGISNGSEWYLGRYKKPFLYGKETREYHQKNYPNIQYYDFLPIFEKKSNRWDPKVWVDTFKRANAEHVIFTAKHHDGVCMYPTLNSTFHTKRDFVGELCDLVKKGGMRFGIYVSLMQWGIGKKGKNFEKYKIMLKAQLYELVERYEPDILWADGDWTNTLDEWGLSDFLLWVNKTRPNLILNNRWGEGFEDMSIPFLSVKQDRFIPKKKLECDWQHVNTISSSWGYCEKVEYKCFTKIIVLCRRVNKLGGIFTINIGPKPNGELGHEGEILEALDLGGACFNTSNENVKKCMSALSKKIKVSEREIEIVIQHVEMK